MRKPPINHSYIELHVPDFNQAKDFYGQLGFEVVWERPPEESKGYLVLRRDDNILCFWAGNEKAYAHPFFKRFPKDTPRGYGVEIVLMIPDLDALYRTAQGTADIVEEMTEQPWGLRDFRVRDPFGFYLRFTQPDNILNPENAVA